MATDGHTNPVLAHGMVAIGCPDSAVLDLTSEPDGFYLFPELTFQLPEAGTYQIDTNIRYEHVGPASSFLLFTLWDATLDVDVTGTGTMMSHINPDPGTTEFDHGSASESVEYTVDQPTTIEVYIWKQVPGGPGPSIMRVLADCNGLCRVRWKRVA